MTTSNGTLKIVWNYYPPEPQNGFAGGVDIDITADIPDFDKHEELGHNDPLVKELRDYLWQQCETKRLGVTR